MAGVRQAVGLITVLALVVGLVGVASGSTKSQRFTGYGATKKDWLAHHTPDPNPKLVKGCCFLPKQKNGTDRYFAVQYGDGTFAPPGRAFSYEMSFDPPISAALARVVVKREVPPDARLAGHRVRGTCEQFAYTSKTLTKIFGRGAVVGVEFSRTGAGGPYHSVVGDIILTPLNAPTQGC